MGFQIATDRSRLAAYSTFGYLLVFLIFWTVIPIVLRQDPPSDNFEQLNWALHPALGYAKHPPLPTWILWLFERVLPAGVSLTYLLGAAQVLITIVVAYWLGRLTLDAPRAWLGAMLISCISYHTLRMHFYNHNTALLCANAAAMLCAWRAAGEKGCLWWAALGVCWAAGMLSKYQMAVPIVCNVVFLFIALRADLQRMITGVGLSALVAVLLLSPHILWLIQNHFPTFDYASNSLGAALSAAARWDRLLRFLASQALRILPAVVLLFMMHLLAQRHRDVDPPAATPQPMAGVFWSIHAIGPMLLMSLMAVLAGVDLQMHWGTAFLWALPMWHLSTQRGRELLRVPRTQLLGLTAAVQALLMAGKLLLPDL